MKAFQKPLTNFSTMTISKTEEFEHLTDKIWRAGSPIELYCSHNDVTNHRKLNARLKTGDELEYIDPATGASAKLSEDDIFEINEIPSFKNYMQNETGPKKACPLDITELSRYDFTCYLTDDYDEDNPDKYNNK